MRDCVFWMAKLRELLMKPVPVRGQVEEQKERAHERSEEPMEQGWVHERVEPLMENERAHERVDQQMEPLAAAG